VDECKPLVSGPSTSAPPAAFTAASFTAAAYTATTTAATTTAAAAAAAAAADATSAAASTGRGRYEHSPEAKAHLFQFWNMHGGYPTAEERDVLAAKSGLTAKQVKTFFGNRRTTFAKDGKDIPGRDVDGSTPGQRQYRSGRAPRKGKAPAKMDAGAGAERKMTAAQRDMMMNYGLGESDSEDEGGTGAGGGGGGGGGRGGGRGSDLHSSTFQLSVSAFCGIGGALRVCLKGARGSLRLCMVCVCVRRGLG